MAYCILLIVRGLPEGFPNFLAEEVRIVPESTAASRLLEYPAAAVTLANRWHGYH
jgi:hypothetical protein